MRIVWKFHWLHLGVVKPCAVDDSHFHCWQQKGICFQLKACLFDRTDLIGKATSNTAPRDFPTTLPLAKNRESAGLSFSLLASSPFLSETSRERTPEGVHSRLLSRASLAWLLPAPRNWELARRLALVLPVLQHRVREKSYSGPGNILKVKARVRMGPLQNTQE